MSKKIITADQERTLKEFFLSGAKITTKQMAARTGIHRATIGYYKGKWGFSKKRRARKTTNGVKTKVSTSHVPSISAFKAAYDACSVMHKAVLLNNISDWVREETAHLNSLK